MKKLIVLKPNKLNTQKHMKALAITALLALTLMSCQPKQVPVATDSPIPNDTVKVVNTEAPVHP